MNDAPTAIQLTSGGMEPQSFRGGHNNNFRGGSGYLFIRFLNRVITDLKVSNVD